ncbi:MAG: hypothetical protein RLZZ242_682, partial [Bacteroidota bacterium]
MKKLLLFSMVAIVSNAVWGQGKTFEVYKTDAEWKKQLNGLQYYVLR